MSKNDNTNTLKEENKNILFVTHNYIRRKGDFAGVFLHLLATRLTEMGMSVQVVAPHDAGTDEYEEIDGIKIHRFRYADDDHETLAYRGNMHRQVLKNPLKIRKLIKFLKSGYKTACSVIESENISTVSIHWVIPNGIIGYWLKDKFGDRIKLFYHSHGTDIRILTKFYLVYLFFKPILNKAVAWTVVSNFLKRLILERDVYIADKIRVMPMPTDEKLFYPDDNIPEELNLVVAASRLTVQKRLDVLIKAIGLLANELTKLKLEIYGAGPEEQKLNSLIKSSGLQERIKIFQPVSQEKLREIYNRAAAVVLNSVDEGFGLALAEAMFCRRAVIGSDSGGINDIIDDNQTGLLVSEDNPEELAGAIKDLINDPVRRRHLAEAGYNKAMSNFSISAIARRFSDLFKCSVE